MAVVEFGTAVLPPVASVNVFLALFSFQPGGGRNDVDPRFISLFSTYNITFPSQQSLHHIFCSILKGHTKPFAKSVHELSENLTTATMELYARIVRDLPPTPSK